MNFKDKRILGRTSLSVSRLGLAGGYGVPREAVERAFYEYGINYFYWSTPRKNGMGDGLRNLVRGNRDDIVIALQSYDHLGISVKRCVNKGLEALRISHADVLLLGWHNRRPVRKVIDEAIKLKESGLVRYIGMSGHNRKLFGTLAEQKDSPIDLFMVRYNAAHRGAEEEIFPYLGDDSSARPGLTTYTATRWGKLLNKKKMPAGEEPLTAADCYRFVLSNKHADLCMMGPSSMEEMLEGVSALEKGPLSDEEMKRVRMIGDHVHG